MKTPLALLALLSLAGLASASMLLRVRADLMREVTGLQNVRGHLESELASREGQVSAGETQIRALQAELAEARARTSHHETASSGLRAELASTRSHLASQEQSLLALEKEARALREAVALAKLEITQAGADEIAAYQSRIAALEEDLAAATERKHPVSEPEPVLPTTVPVLEVGPANAFVVLPYGEALGARLQQVLEIRRGTEPVATVLITQVHSDHAIAQVRPDTLRAGLHKGDLATITSPP